MAHTGLLVEREPLADVVRGALKRESRALLAAYVVLPDQRGLLDCLLDASVSATSDGRPFAWSGEHIAALGLRPVWTKPTTARSVTRPAAPYDTLPHSAFQRPHTAGDYFGGQPAEPTRQGTTSRATNAAIKAVTTVLGVMRHPPGSCVLLRFAAGPVAPPADAALSPGKQGFGSWAGTDVSDAAPSPPHKLAHIAALLGGVYDIRFITTF